MYFCLAARLCDALAELELETGVGKIGFNWLDAIVDSDLYAMDEVDFVFLFKTICFFQLLDFRTVLLKKNAINGWNESV